MPDDSVGDAGPSIDNRRLLLVGAGPGLGMAVARRFADGGYRVTLVAAATDGQRQAQQAERSSGGIWSAPGFF